MSIAVNYSDFNIDIPVDVYNRLNRASREFDACITDVYYYVMNANSINNALYNEMIDAALKAHYAYSIKKDEISNNYVIPAVKEKYHAGDKDLITNSWSINFDGSNICEISNISISKDDQEIIYNSDAPEEWLEKICDVSAKLTIYDQIIAKLMVALSTSTSSVVRESYEKIRQIRIDLAIENEANKKAFLDEVVSDLITDYDPTECTWNLNPIDKKFIITHTVK